MLTYLSGAYCLTNTTAFYDHFMTLAVEDEYLLSIINLKMLPPVNVNFSDDEVYAVVGVGM